METRIYDANDKDIKSQYINRSSKRLKEAVTVMLLAYIVIIFTPNSNSFIPFIIYLGFLPLIVWLITALLKSRTDKLTQKITFSQEGIEIYWETLTSLINENIRATDIQIINIKHEKGRHGSFIYNVIIQTNYKTIKFPINSMKNEELLEFFQWYCFNQSISLYGGFYES